MNRVLIVAAWLLTLPATAAELVVVMERTLEIARHQGFAVIIAHPPGGEPQAAGGSGASSNACPARKSRVPA
jgi:hypothetical protein